MNEECLVTAIIAGDSLHCGSVSRGTWASFVWGPIIAPVLGNLASGWAGIGHLWPPRGPVSYPVQLPHVAINTLNSKYTTRGVSEIFLSKQNMFSNTRHPGPHFSLPRSQDRLNQKKERKKEN